MRPVLNPQSPHPHKQTHAAAVPEVLRPRTCGSRCGHPGEQTRGSASHTRRGQRPGADPTRLRPLHLLRRPRVPGRPHPTDQPRRPRHSRQPRPGVPGLQQRQAREAAHRMAPRPRRVRGRFITQDRGRTSTPTKPQTGAGALTSTCRRLRHQPVAQQMSPEGRAPVNGSRVLFLGASPVGSGLLDRSGVRLSLTPGFTCRSTAGAGRVAAPDSTAEVGTSCGLARSPLARAFCGATGRTDRPGRPGLQQPMRSLRVQHFRGLFQGQCPGGVPGRPVKINYLAPGVVVLTNTPGPSAESARRGSSPLGAGLPPTAHLGGRLPWRRWAI